MKTKTVLQMIVIVGLAAGGLLAAQAPHISSVVNSADFAVGIPLGSFGTVYGTGLSAAAYQASVYPFPVSLGTTQAALCPLQLGKLLAITSECLPLSLIYASPTQINFVMPVTLPPPSRGFTLSSIAVVVSVGGAIDDGASSGTNGNQLLGSGIIYPLVSPRIFREGYDCFIDSRFQDAGKNCGLSWVNPPTYSADRGAVTDLSGKLITSANPAHISQYLVAWVSGLGAAKPNTAIWLFNIPVYGSKSDSYEPINPLYAGESSFPGLFQINFQVPAFIATGISGYSPPFPCGNYAWEVSLSIGTANNNQSNLVQIPVVVKPGDVACAP